MRNKGQAGTQPDASGSEQAGPAGHLAGRVERPQALAAAQRNRMYELLARYFTNITYPQFEKDLAEKEWVILLADAGSGQIQGFSTLMQLQVVVDQHPIVAFFSGDTIIHRDYWGEAELPRLWGRHVFKLAETIPTAPVYWFLTSSGYKTYRFLPVFFREFYPTHRRPTPPGVKRVLDALGHLKFPAEYDAERGLVRSAAAAPLRPDVAQVTPQRLKNPHVAFFVEANPGHAAGDQLACLAELSLANLTGAGRRVVGVDQRRA
jgi:hypothetical protein